MAHWRSFTNAREAHSRLQSFFTSFPDKAEPMPLPPATGALSVEGVYAGPPGVSKALLKAVSFKLEPGTSLGVIGPSASGKSTLARTLLGIWPAMAGAVRLDGADIGSWSREQLGPQIGYLPQDVELYAGKVSENIARFEEDASPEKIVRAAQAAGCHEMILRLREGYDTQIGEGGAHLSAGQRQRVALARALYGDPALVVLDEPNSNLDSAGDDALAKAMAHMRQNGQTVIVIAHRPSAIASVDKLLMLDAGQVMAFGPREEVLAKVLKRPIGGNVSPLQTGRGGQS